MGKMKLNVKYAGGKKSLYVCLKKPEQLLSHRNVLV